MLCLPSHLIVDALLWFQPRRRCLTVIFGVHLGEGRHHKGLTDVQIGTAVRAQLVQPLCRCTEVAVVLILCCPCRPCLTQSEDTCILRIKVLFPLSVYAPVVTYKTSRFIPRFCRRHIIKLMFPLNTRNRRGLFANPPRALQIQAKRTVFLAGMVLGRFFCPRRVHISRTDSLRCPSVEIQTALPVPILIIQLCCITICGIFTRIVRISNSDPCRAEINLRERARVTHLTFMIAQEEVQTRIHMVGQAHAFLLDIMNICALIPFELRRINTVDLLFPCHFIIVEPISTAKLIKIVIESESLIPDTDTITALSIVAKARMNLVCHLLLCDDIDNTDHRLTAIEHGTAALYNLDTLDAARRDRIEVVLSMPRNRVAVDENKYPILKAAQIYFIRHRPLSCAGRTEGLINKTIDLCQHIRCTCCPAVLDLLRRDDRRRGRHIEIPLLCARRRHNNLTERVGRHQFICFSPRIRCLRRIDLPRHR